MNPGSLGAELFAPGASHTHTHVVTTEEEPPEGSTGSASPRHIPGGDCPLHQETGVVPAHPHSEEGASSSTAGDLRSAGGPRPS